MGMTVKARPNEVNGVTKSDWVASKNPVLYKIRREDHAITQVNDAAGFAQVQINGIDLTAYYEVGNSVAVMGLNLISVPVPLTGTITASAFSGGNTLITTTISYASVAPSGADDFINNTSKRTDWKVEIEVYNSTTSVSLNDVQFRFSPSPANWVTTIDISTILSKYVSAEWSLPSGDTEAETSTWLKFYITYQEFYDGALISSATSDSANPYWVAHASKQITWRNIDGFFLDQSVGGNLQSYVPSSNTREWLTRFRITATFYKMRMWRDWPFTLSYIYPSGMTNLKFRRIEYDAAGTASVVSTIALATAGLNRIKVASLNASTKQITGQIVEHNATSFSAITLTSGTAFNTGWSNAAGNGAPAAPPAVAWSLGAANAATASNMTNGQESQILTPVVTGTVATLLDSYLRFVMDLTVPNTKSVTLKIYYRLVGGTWAVGGQTAVVGTGLAVSTTVTSGVFNSTSDQTTALTEVGIFILSNDNTVGTITVDNVAFSQSKIQLSSALTIDVEEPGPNPVHLYWKNSICGDSFFQFSFNQEIGLNLSNSKKANRQVLFVEQLKLVEWLALNELIDTAEVYKNNITELNSTVIKSHSKIGGNQIYVMDSSGNKIGVIVIPSVNKTDTRAVSHMFQLEIEYPEIYQ